MCFPLTLDIFASETNVIKISSEEEFVTFSTNCKLDTFSKGKQFTLTKDLDMTGMEFHTIPIFCGTFDGNGHTVSGISLSENYAYQGLFRHIQQGATVKNLGVEGSVMPLGQRTFIGGIAGENKGVIENCSFSGLINGISDVGGIAGINGSSGIILSCSVYGGVYGESGVGGIVGNNSGTILQCHNNGQINNIMEEHSFSFEDVTLNDIKATNNIKEVSDIGGIVGINVGIIENCENIEKIGYPHVGYNVGGIAGRQRGYINNCTNKGMV